ncbi:unnamed protein product [Closterium sp. Naga37s-1]|nr:unnamed protein product [Closterium sp. Naga37s-1]
MEAPVPDNALLRVAHMALASTLTSRPLPLPGGLAHRRQRRSFLHEGPALCMEADAPDGKEDVSLLRDPRMEEDEAPNDVILRISLLALTCTATLTATRPSMARLAHDLEGIRGEVGGEEVNRAAVRVDEVVGQSEGSKGQMRTLDEELRIVNESLDAHAHADADATELSYEGDRLLS